MRMNKNIRIRGRLSIRKEIVMSLEGLLQGEIEACITPQILHEFFAVVTNQKKVEYPLSCDEAFDICLDL